MVETDVEVQLRQSGLRVTRPRVAVLRCCATTRTRHRHDHPAGAQVAGDVSHQAVYDVLRALTEAGLLRRIQPAGSVARYEVRVGDNHHHVVCRSCGVIADVDCAVGDAPCLDGLRRPRLPIDEAEVVYWGPCPDAAAAVLLKSPARKEQMSDAT